MTAAVGACALFDPDADGTFTVVMPERELVDPLIVDVIDHTGTVTAIGIAESRVEDDVAADPNDAAVLIVTWVGGLCDANTTLTVGPRSTPFGSARRPKSVLAPAVRWESDDRSGFASTRRSLPNSWSSCDPGSEGNGA